MALKIKKMSYLLNLLSQSGDFLSRSRLLKILFSIATLGMISQIANASKAIAAETVILRHRSSQESIKIPFQELEAFAKGGSPSSLLTTFLDRSGTSPEEMSTLLDASIPDTGIPLGNTDVQFVLFQLNKLVGDPLDRENPQPLVVSLRSAYLDQNMSFLELLRRYPKAEVELNVSELSRVYQDVDLFVQRISPLFNFLEDLLPDLVCDCQLPSDEAAPALLSLKRQIEISPEIRTGHHSFASSNDKSALPPKANVIPTVSSYLASQSGGQVFLAALDGTRLSPKTPQVSRKVVLTFGPVSRSFKIEDLNQFALTGKVPSEWKSYLRLTKMKPQKLRELLTDQKQINSKDLDNLLYSLPGEYALFQLGQLVTTPSKQTNVQALRSSIMLSAINDEQISLLEVLQNYPGQVITIDAKKMLKFTKNLKGKGAVKLATANLEDVLVAAQEAIAQEVCDCVEPQPESSNSQNSWLGADQPDQFFLETQCLLSKVQFLQQ
ncbi:alpha/beta hydrolase [Lyngbya confervoides]|uniref:Alpha/beta hydrolase n=1 Tax=Lyngbya confervoides BDU141951 TaxID=1574623 RepID=A0ABD4T8R6_9CYAN|nr:alpha/beta hydrolase [Lyngbya confervoides]MCM1984967.1 alpha/beta hydrolase [Lyngbya confervoides BDU141951]